MTEILDYKDLTKINGATSNFDNLENPHEHHYLPFPLCN